MYFTLEISRQPAKLASEAKKSQDGVKKQEGNEKSVLSLEIAALQTTTYCFPGSAVLW